MAVQQEIWTEALVEYLYKDNAVLETATVEDQYVLSGKVVHIPQAGAIPAITRNRNTFPATAVVRGDTDVSYTLDGFYSDPTHIPDIEKAEISYDKVQSVIKNHFGSLNEYVTNWLIFHWRASLAGAIIRTLGSAVPVQLSGATGNRKKFTKESLKKAKFLMDKDSVPMNDRYALISAAMMDELLDDADLKLRDSSLELNMVEGAVKKLYGFTLLQRASVLVYGNEATPVAIDPAAAIVATSNDAVLCYQKQSVARALGEVRLYEDIGNPLYYGDIYSALLRMGGRQRRADGKGVIAIVQDAAA